jgi:hypothetical protein
MNIMPSIPSKYIYVYIHKCDISSIHSWYIDVEKKRFENMEDKHIFAQKSRISVATLYIIDSSIFVML